MRDDSTSTCGCRIYHSSVCTIAVFQVFSVFLCVSGVLRVLVCFKCFSVFHCVSGVLCVLVCFKCS